VNGCLSYGFAVSLSPKDYRAIYKAQEVPKKIRHDSEYGLCFRMCVHIALQYMATRREEWPLTMVLEGGHRNSGDAIRIFDEMKSQLAPQWHGILGQIAFDSKNTCVPLAAADALAHTLFRSRAGFIPNAEGRLYTRYDDVTILDAVPNRSEAQADKVPIRIQHFLLNEKSMTELTKEFLAP
jgi:hypothetical protein